MSAFMRYSPAVRHSVLLAALLVLLGLTAVFAAQPPASPKPSEPPPAPAAGAGVAPAKRAASVPPPSRFEAVDVLVDPGKQPLAAWQVELTGSVPGGAVKIVGIEGGESPAYAKPPYYDQKAMSQDRVIVAGLSVAPAKDLPAGRTRVARIHLQVVGSEMPVQYLVRLMAAANPDAEQLNAAATAELVEKRP